MFPLNTKIGAVNRVGEATGKKLNRLGIFTVEDLLLYFPFRYDDFSRITPIAELVAGTSANVVGQIELIRNKRSPRRRMNITEAIVNDGTESVRVTWFNQPFIAKNLKEGDRVSLAGKVEEDYGGPYFAAPSYEKIVSGMAVNTQGLVPNYHLTAGFTQKQLRYLIKQVIGSAKLLTDWLSPSQQKEYGLIGLVQAIEQIHFPTSRELQEAARKRLAFDELFLLQLQAHLIKRELQSQQSPVVPFLLEETKEFLGRLPFKLTDDQRKAAWEILQDLEKSQTMTRLLEGDVGSGKTLVATMAMLNVAKSGRQSVLLAPTEILAHQHYETISRVLSEQGVRVGLVTRAEKRFKIEDLRLKNNAEGKKAKKISAQEVIENSDIVIGTHALIQDKIEFKNLAFAVVDEQHRFGVNQRKALMEKSGQTGLTPHLLTMTATPIPRSLALAIYGDLEISIIKEKPADRLPIKTKLVAEKSRQAAYKFIRDQIAEGRQAFVVCPLIDYSENSDQKSVKEEYEKLNILVFPDLEIGMMHGKLKPAEKERIMQEFLDNKIKILVSTSVVEVGVDVPNASIMMIEGAERFGLAQLHQFRGRVGRSKHQSYCLLFSDTDKDKSAERLQALVDCNDGFALAKMDLKFRGAGEVYGTMQSGFPELKIASLFDYELMKEARAAVLKLVEADGALQKHPLLREKIKGSLKGVHLE